VAWSNVLKMSEPEFDYFEHTADVGLRARGRSLDELFIHAARGMIGLLVERPPTSGHETHPITLSATSTEELLHRWLKELLFWFHIDKFLPAVYHIQIVQEDEEEHLLRGWIDGERFDAAVHQQGTEIKGVTYHQFRVEQLEEGWQAEIIFDV
jgi:SHS2 domain-containing protein